MNDSELYVHDHLLIQFMLENYAPISASGSLYVVETAYKEWLAWSKMLKLEENKDECK